MSDDSERKELFSQQIRMQLSFVSFMKLALLTSIVISVMFTLLLNLMMDPRAHQAVIEKGAVIWLNLYLFLGSLGLEVIASMLAFGVYWFWCSGHRGHLATGKFAFTIEKKNTTPPQE